MITHTISTPFTTGITLGSSYAYNSPLVVTSSGSVKATGGNSNAITSADSATIDNAGYIYGGRNGVYLSQGGTVTNESTGTIITGSLDAIHTDRYNTDAAPTTLFNAGLIDSVREGIYLTTGGLVSNTGTIIAATSAIATTNYDQSVQANVINDGIITAKTGLQLNGGGYVDNQSAGTITGSYTGVLIGGSNVGTVINAGSIYGGRQAVILNGGGYVENLADATISGHYDAVQFGGIASNTLVNDGSVYGGRTGVNTSNGYVLNNSGASIYGHYQGVQFYGTGLSTLVNEGSIDGGRQGVIMNTGGYVENQTGQTITGNYQGVQFGGTTASTLVNNGSIYGGRQGVAMYTGGYIHNAAGNTISGGNGGINVAGAYATAVTVVNDGVITGNQRTGIYLTGGGTVFNDANAIISGGSDAIGANKYYNKGLATIVNAGVISGGNTGIYLDDGGYITNESGATISGSNYAVNFAAGTSGVVVVDPNAVFIGKVEGGASANTTLELAAGMSIGTITGLGTQYNDLGNIQIDTAANWVLTGANTVASDTTITNAGLFDLQDAMLAGDAVLINDGDIVLDPSSMTISSLGGAGAVTIGTDSTLSITGDVSAGETIQFGGATGVLDLTDTGAVAGTIALQGQGDLIDITDLSIASGITDSFDSATGVLSISYTGDGGTPYTLTFASGSFTDSFPVLDDNRGGVYIDTDTPCFAAGTRILTTRGEVAVEDIMRGDVIVTVRPDGPLSRCVVWTGHRHVSFAHHPQPALVRPVRILADAFGPGIPERDLRLSPHHAVYIDSHLFEAISLVNGLTIFQEQNGAQVTYHHIELDSHDVLVAEGMACESFLDTGTKNMFQEPSNAGVAYPDFSPHRLSNFCAPLVTEGELLDNLRVVLLARAYLMMASFPFAICA